MILINNLQHLITHRQDSLKNSKHITSTWDASVCIDYCY